MLTNNDRLAPWIHLLRVPNLFTVPGDPLAGFCLAWLAVPQVSPASLKVILLPFLSLLFYTSGLVLNDYFDLEEDRRERPTRPLASGRINPSVAFLVGLILSVLGILISFFLGDITFGLSIVLVLLILSYNAYLKRIMIFGPLTMGLCRGFSFLIGASMLDWGGIFNLPVLSSFVFLSLFIGSVTFIASKETDIYQEGGLRWVPLMILTGWFLGLTIIGVNYNYPFKSMAVLLSIFIVGWAYYCGRQLVHRASPEVIQKTIGLFIRTLIPIRGTLISLKGGSFIFLAIIILLAWPISQHLATRFYAS